MEQAFTTLSFNGSLTTDSVSESWWGGCSYGFQGMEMDNEVFGNGNSYDFGARMLNARNGRWFSVDPLESKYPYLNGYNFVSNMPIIAIDPDGKRIIIIVQVEMEVDGEKQKVNIPLDVVTDRALLEMYVPNSMKAYDIAKLTSLEGVDKNLGTGSDLINTYEQSNTEDLYIRWMDNDQFIESGTSANAKSDISPIYWERILGVEFNKNRKLHLITFNNLLFDEFMIEGIQLEDGTASSTFIHELLFHIYWDAKGVKGQEQHNKAYETSPDVHKNSSDNAASDSPQDNLDKNAEKSAKKYLRKNRKSENKKQK